MIFRTLLTLLLSSLSFNLFAEENWPQFRGPSASGVSPNPAPTSFDVPSNKNVLWKTPIPGLGLSSPVIWGNQLFITTAVSANDDQALRTGLYGDIKPVDERGPFAWKVISLDKTTGRILWEQTALQGAPKIKRHPKSSHANPTCATDGKRLLAFFGSEGLYCYDLTGKLLWKLDLGLLDSGYFVAPDAQWGFAASPILFEDKVILQCDVQKGSFIAAYDAADGKIIWRTERGDVPTWSTPAVVRTPDRTQVIANGFKQIAGYDLANGKLLWSMRGLGDIPVPTPIFAHNVIFITTAHGPGAPMYAIKPSAAGDISLPAGQNSNEHIAWSEPRGGNYMQTPIVVGDLLFACMDNGLLRCYDAKTGKLHYRQRINGGTGFTASPIAVNNHLYFPAEDGQVYVIKATPQYELVSTNPLGDQSMATPAASDGTLFFRTKGHMIAVR